MSDNLLDSVPTFNRLSLRAVLVRPGEDAAAALAAAGIHNPVPIPVVLGDTAGPNASASAPGIPAVLEMPTANTLSPRGQNQVGAQPSPAETEASRPQGTAMLPPAFGQQPLAPVRRRGS